MRSTWLLAAVGSIAMSGCYLKPMSSNNPIQTREGVRIRLVGQDCEDHIGADSDPVTRSLGVKLSIENPTHELLRFKSEAVHLSVGGGSIAPLNSAVYQIAPGETRGMVLSFTHDAVCASRFKLVFDGALALGEQPVEAAELLFTP